jgi:hypothetical protein
MWKFMVITSIVPESAGIIVIFDKNAFCITEKVFVMDTVFTGFSHDSTPCLSESLPAVPDSQIASSSIS